MRKAVCIGGPISGQSIPVDGACAVVMGDHSGRYEWVPSGWVDDYLLSGWEQFFAVWYPGGRR